MHPDLVTSGFSATSPAGMLRHGVSEHVFGMERSLTH